MPELPLAGVPKLAPSVTRWIAEGSPTRGPLVLAPPEVALAGIRACTELAPGAPAGPFPGLWLGSVRGCPLIVMLETGAVVALHHDATLYEVARDCADAPNPQQFGRRLAQRGSAVSLDELRSLAVAVADWPSLRPTGLREARRIRALASGLGISVGELEKRRKKSPLALEFLGLDEAVLDALVAADRKVARARAGTTEKLNLSECWLDAWPDGLDLAPVHTLDLSFNPDLPWADVPARLAGLPNLRLLRVLGCELDLGALAAALPGVKVRAEEADLSRLGCYDLPLLGPPPLNMRGATPKALDDALGQLRSRESLRMELHLAGPGPIVPFPAEIRRWRQLRSLEVYWEPARGLTTPGLPDWLTELPLESVELDLKPPFPLDTLAVLTTLPHLRRLALRAEGAVHLDGFAALEVLDAPGLRFDPGPNLPVSLRRLQLRDPPANLEALVELQDLAYYDGREGAAARLAPLIRLERLRAVLRADEPLPGSLTRLRWFEGSATLPELPLLEFLSLFSGTLPARLPNLRELHWTGRTFEEAEAAIEAMAGYPRLERVTIHNFWPANKAPPSALARLTQLDRLRLLNTAWNRDGLRRIREWLPNVSVTSA